MMSTNYSRHKQGYGQKGAQDIYLHTCIKLINSLLPTLNVLTIIFFVLTVLFLIFHLRNINIK